MDTVQTANRQAHTSSLDRSTSRQSGGPEAGSRLRIRCAELLQGSLNLPPCWSATDPPAARVLGQRAATMDFSGGADGVTRSRMIA